MTSHCNWTMRKYLIQFLIQKKPHAPLNNMLSNVRFTYNHVKDLDQVVIHTYKKRFCMNAISKKKFRVKRGSMIRTVIKPNKAHMAFDADATL